MELLRVFLLVSFLLVFCLYSDYVIATQPFWKGAHWGLYDGFVHGMIGVMVLWPLYRNYTLSTFILVFLVASLIDVDHFIAAGSLSLQAAVSLPMRPLSHSLAFALMAGLVAHFMFRRRRFMFWTVFAALASHVIRDASSGLTMIFYPLEITRIPVAVYLAAETGLLMMSWGVRKAYRL